MTYRRYHRHTLGAESVRYRTKIGFGIEENHLRKITVIAPLAFGAAAVMAYNFGDLRISRFVQRFDSPYFHWLMVAVSWPGNLGRQWIVAVCVAALLLRFRLRIEAGWMLASLGSIWLLTNALKFVIGRQRPAPDLVEVYAHSTTRSFPSGHVTSYIALYGFLFYIVYTLMRPSLIRSALLAFFSALISLVGLSRVYLGAHWASDVLGGYCLGFFWLALMIYLYQRFKWSRETREPH
jgi:membrane-associated phospholipid phosphatase